MQLVPEPELIKRMIALVEQVKQTYPDDWQDPFQLAQALGIQAHRTTLGPATEGLAYGSTLVVNEGVGSSARKTFTSYHEVAHYLIRQSDELLSILHEQFLRDEDFDEFKERLSNIGAAQFIMPRHSVLELIQKQGFSVSLIKVLSENTSSSLQAACCQLSLCAPHRCIGVVCQPYTGHQTTQEGLLKIEEEKQRETLKVTFSVASPKMQYSLGRGTIIPYGHLIYEVYQLGEGEVVSGKDFIPWQTGTKWEVKCEAMQIGTQVFSFFHADDPPAPPNENQLAFSWPT